MVAALLTRLLVPWPQAMHAPLGRHTGRLEAQFAVTLLVDLFTVHKLQMSSRWNEIYLRTRLLV